VPVFEQAKPIGTALNDWGKKDPERLAFEDAGAFAREHFHITPARDDPKDPTKPAAGWHDMDGKPPMEQHFFDQLEHHQREGFLHLKLAEPRAYDFNRLRTWDDRLRMPQFQFARSRKQADESDDDYLVRQEREEAEAREAVMTFVLGLTADPISLKYVNSPKPDRLAEVKGRQVIEKFNCAGCHQVQPGVYEFKPTVEAIDRLDKAYATAATKFPADHVFPGHNAWTGTPSPSPDRVIAHGTEPRLDTENFDRPLLTLRLSEALRYTNNDKVTRDIPTGSTAYLVPEDVFAREEPFGGVFANLLIPYLAKKNSTEFEGKPTEARAVLPPPLLREGERVQPKWLYQFLLNPKPIRPETRMVLRMPRFNMSPEEAQTLVNYFGAVDKLNNPGAGLTYPYLTIDQHDPKFWSDRNREYQERLNDAKSTKPEDRAAALLNAEAEQAKTRLAAAKKDLADAKTDDEKKAKQKEIDDLTAAVKALDERVQKKDFAALTDAWKSSDAYAADAYRIVANKTLCLNCHNLGKLHIDGPKGPNLDLAWERLRPEWTQMWISNPERLFAYSPTMPQNFGRDSVKYQEYFVGDSRDQARAARDLLMDLPRLADLPANRATHAAVEGGAK
jgi:cytochrome c2